MQIKNITHLFIKILIISSFILLLLTLKSCSNKPESDKLTQIGMNSNLPVFAVGEMHESQKKPYGRIDLTKIATDNLYALGTGENLIGEIVIINGKNYYFTAHSENDRQKTHFLPGKAAFFISAYVKDWQRIPIPKGVNTLREVEKFISGETKNYLKANPMIPFLLEGDFDSCNIHIARLHESARFSGPHKKLLMLGFFTKKYVGYYTYKDNLTHIHTVPLDDNSSFGGHVDNFKFTEGDNKYLYLPKIIP